MWAEMGSNAGIMMSGWAPMWAAKLARDVKMWSKLVGLKKSP